MELFVTVTKHAKRELARQGLLFLVMMEIFVRPIHVLPIVDVGTVHSLMDKPLPMGGSVVGERRFNV